MSCDFYPELYIGNSNWDHSLHKLTGKMIILLDKIIFTNCLKFIDSLKKECNLVLIIKLETDTDCIKRKEILQERRMYKKRMSQSINLGVFTTKRVKNL